jgi:hypothetical protein
MINECRAAASSKESSQPRKSGGGGGIGPLVGEWDALAGSSATVAVGVVEGSTTQDGTIQIPTRETAQTIEPIIHPDGRGSSLVELKSGLS